MRSLVLRSATREGPPPAGPCDGAPRDGVPRDGVPRDGVPLLGGRRFAVLLMGGALFSKLLGFVREIVMAHTLGASLVADGFRGALTAVLLPLAVLQNESVPAILVPMCREWQRTGEAGARLCALTLALGGIALGLMLAVQALGMTWVGAIVGGFSPEGRALTLDFVRVMALGMPACVVLNCLAAGEIALGRSRLTTIRASILNLAVLTGLAVMGLTGSVAALAWSFTIAFNGLAACAVAWLWREGLLDPAGARPALILAAGRDFLRGLRPLLAIPLVEQAHNWIERLLASRLATGTVASMDYARTLTDSALLLISQPLGLTVLAAGPAADTARQVERIARPILAVMLPACVFLAGFAPELARVVFARGAFGDEAVFLTSEALRGIAAGLWASTLGWILMRVLNGAGRNGAAAGVLTAAYLANIAVNLATCAAAGNGLAGPMMLGLGEAARGLVLLAGTGLLLGCARPLVRATLLAAGPAALMGLAAWQIPLAVAGPLARLAAGAAACAACILVGLALAAPSLRATLGAARRRPAPESPARSPRPRASAPHRCPEEE
ncbi:lipid II flippase MurJ [Methylobacterium sp. WSM2598]|uniref:lipid II flippase MurJ n=1 Tax=Methylobacterium sp. WSM2598 TaxID=398261 RepID=UPI001F3561B2|nr:lipid II flippase MurJ [Methylobacterium sp. WSM2598]